MDTSPARFPGLIGACPFQLELRHPQVYLDIYSIQRYQRLGKASHQWNTVPPPFWNHGTLFKAMTAITSHSALGVIMVCYHHAGETNIQSRFYSKYQTLLVIPNGAHPVDMERSYKCISQGGKLPYIDRSSEVEPFKPIPIRPTIPLYVWNIRQAKPDRKANLPLLCLWSSLSYRPWKYNKWFLKYPLLIEGWPTSLVWHRDWSWSRKRSRVSGQKLS